jgi:hypothetical protein
MVPFRDLESIWLTGSIDLTKLISSNSIPTNRGQVNGKQETPKRALHRRNINANLQLIFAKFCTVLNSLLSCRNLNRIGNYSCEISHSHTCSTSASHIATTISLVSNLPDSNRNVFIFIRNRKLDRQRRHYRNHNKIHVRNAGKRTSKLANKLPFHLDKGTFLVGSKHYHRYSHRSWINCVSYSRNNPRTCFRLFTQL